MKIASTILQIRETKEAAMAKVNAANNNEANNKSNSNAAVDQSKVVKTDTVDLSQKGVALAATTATKSESNIQEAVDKLVKANEKSTEKPQAVTKNARESIMESQQELGKLAKGLKKLGMGSREVGKIVRSANREANKTVGVEIKQAYQDYRSQKIDKQTYRDKLVEAAAKKLESIVSALGNAFDQKLAVAQGKTVSDDENTEKVKETANKTKSTDATKPTDETRVTDADDASKANAEKNTEKTKEASNETVAKADDDKKAEKTTPPGLAKKEELPPGLAKKVVASTTEAASTTVVAEEDIISSTIKAASKESADNSFSQIVDIFNDIDKMVNGFADKVEGMGSNDEDEGDSLVSFASKLNKMFSGINKAFGNELNGGDVGHKLGIAQIKKETISQLFSSEHGSGAINRIGDAGDGSGNFNAVRFMSSLSSSINEGLENYKDVQKAEKESKEESKEVVGTLA